jgi:hypothetical protein
MSDENKLTPSDLTAAECELEQALRSLRPAAAQIDLVGAALAAHRLATRRRLARWQAAAAAAVLVAGGAWLAVGRRGPRPDQVDLHLPAVAPHFDAVAAPAVEPPTLLAYGRALRQSPAELDAMLDRQAKAGAAQSVPVVVFTRWNVNHHPSLGDM